MKKDVRLLAILLIALFLIPMLSSFVVAQDDDSSDIDAPPISEEELKSGFWGKVKESVTGTKEKLTEDKDTDEENPDIDAPPISEEELKKGEDIIGTIFGKLKLIDEVEEKISTGGKIWRFFGGAKDIFDFIWNLIVGALAGSLIWIFSKSKKVKDFPLAKAVSFSKLITAIGFAFLYALVMQAPIANRIIAIGFFGVPFIDEFLPWYIAIVIIPIGLGVAVYAWFFLAGLIWRKIRGEPSDEDAAGDVATGAVVNQATGRAVRGK